ncbi:MarR family winged helix-turn-helix transcriptional regulator [Brevibacterium sp. UMB1308A]|uniref:MarR family winged helix-turn-helix transcriptional regulator n=1 Tax=Brevibacterium sp. UMB1308A TaxID=3050608 RepID=UPI002550B7ED|nr:MarR family winged helix-turn-helix transcriptional regulator [Brevibacterium sp. UMB1308A]MDK8346826.1 MarR family winged helix-turn-helix transcriptional regulator [Brevibacterium sp. UMB1308B]MDK8713974.1 MarR family winged helix-turn-helix transcriptional regulator [Brevibacterium sp. UMB1308A]
MHSDGPPFKHDGKTLDSLAYELVANSSSFRRAYARGLDGRRSLIAIRVLANLQSGGPLRIGELATREAVTQPTMTGIVNRLVADNLVERRADSHDARASAVTLTDTGRQELERARTAAAQSVRPALETLSPDDLEILQRATNLLGRLGDTLTK